jgi:hypothetical protein
MLKAYFFSLMIILATLASPMAHCGESGESTPLTAVQMSTIDMLLDSALLNPRVKGPEAIAIVEKMGMPAVKYGSKKIAGFLFVPVEIDPQGGFDLFLFQTLKCLREASKLDTAQLQKLEEISLSNIEEHSVSAKTVLQIQEIKASRP